MRSTLCHQTSAGEGGRGAGAADERNHFNWVVVESSVSRRFVALVCLQHDTGCSVYRDDLIIVFERLVERESESNLIESVFHC